MGRLTFVTAALLTLLSHRPFGNEAAKLPDGACISEDLSCRTEGDNLLGIDSNVPVGGLNGCLKNAVGRGNDFVSYFGPAGVQFIRHLKF